MSLSLKIQQKIPDSPRFLDLSQIQAWDYTLSDSSIALQLDPKKCHTCASQVCSVPCPKKKFASVTKISTFVFACYSTQIESLKETHPHSSTLFLFWSIYPKEKRQKENVFLLFDIQMIPSLQYLNGCSANH